MGMTHERGKTAKGTVNEGNDVKPTHFLAQGLKRSGSLDIHYVTEVYSKYTGEPSELENSGLYETAK